MVAIFASSIFLALEYPRLQEDLPLWMEWVPTFIYSVDLFFLAVFLLEFLLKIIALGFVFHEHSYLRQPWNILDFFVVVVPSLLLSL